ncbi:hypothetical protein ES705_23206 [subsurface metagenome]
MSNLTESIMYPITAIKKTEDIFPEYRDTPVGLLLEYHNLGRKFDDYLHARLLTGMCMDNRVSLHIPENFSYIMRTGGANLRYYEFQISYAIAVGGIQHIALIAHTNCGMVNLAARKKQFIRGLVDNAGWTQEKAEKHFNESSPMFEIMHEVNFTLGETKHLRALYPKVTIAPLLYKLEDNRLYLISEYEQL